MTQKPSNLPVDYLERYDRVMRLRATGYQLYRFIRDGPTRFAPWKNLCPGVDWAGSSKAAIANSLARREDFHRAGGGWAADALEKLEAHFGSRPLPTVKTSRRKA